MAKRLTKGETKRLYGAILSKTHKLWEGGSPSYISGVLMSSKDMMAIEAIISKYQKKL
jgi:hypothetical protein